MHRLLPYNLQFFAEAESVETPEVAETVEIGEEQASEGADPAEGQQSEGVEQPQFDANAIAAAARRQAENDARAKAQRIDAEYERRFGHLTNPMTGQPIRSQADYLAALDAQQQLQAEAQLKENGVDPSILNQMIAMNPAVRRAEEVIAQAEKQNAERMIMEDVASLSELDSSIKTFADIPADVIQKAMSTGMNLVDAYKIINFGKVSTANREAIQQAAINQMKGKQHMAPVNGISNPESGVDIPMGELSMWKDMFPDKSMAELKKLYNQTL